MVKTELFVLAAVTVTLAPMAVSVPVAVPLDPTTTLPSGRVVGDTPSCPTVVVTPVPDTAIDDVGLEALDVMVTVPLTLPLDVGANVTVNVVLCDAPTVTGVEIPVIENAGLSTET